MFYRCLLKKEQLQVIHNANYFIVELYWIFGEDGHLQSIFGRILGNSDSNFNCAHNTKTARFSPLPNNNLWTWNDQHSRKRTTTRGTSQTDNQNAPTMTLSQTMLKRWYPSDIDPLPEPRHQVTAIETTYQTTFPRHFINCGPVIILCFQISLQVLSC